MEQDNGRFFNCAESALIASNRSFPMIEDTSSSLKIASMFGGGIVGTGETCGAVTGALMYLGLALGTDGSEDPQDFSEKRRRARELGQKFVEAFIDAWGSQRCSVLKAMDKGQIPPMGTHRAKDLGHCSQCNEYVRWSTECISGLVMGMLMKH